MKAAATLAYALIVLGFLVSNEAFARGGRAGSIGGGRAGMPSMAGGRSAVGRTPTIARPSMPRPSISRPSLSGGGGGARPRPSFNAGSRPSGSRPGFATRPSGLNRPQGNRPSLGNLPTPSARPGTGRPSGSLNRPGFTGATRPGAGSRPGFSGRPSAGRFDNYVDVGGSPWCGRPSARPGGGSNRLPGGAANDFLKDRPRPFPGQPGFTTGSTRPGTRPSGGVRPKPGIGDLTDVGRPGAVRPGDLTRPVRPGGGGPAGDRPGGGDRPSGNRPGGNRPGSGNRPGWGNRPDGGWIGSGHRPHHRPDWNHWHDWAHDRWDHINDHWHQHGYHHWYGRDWWHHHHWHHHYPEHVNWWGWATWNAVTDWFPWGWSQPVYYNYGSNVYYADDTVYYGDQPVATADEYAYQAEQIATSVPEEQPKPEDWMPLGVFAITSADETSSQSDPSNYLQLTISKQGIIGGSLQNAATGTVKEIEGMVDQQSQRAAWTVVGQTRPIMETGMGNLTQDTAPALVHFADGTTQQWLLVRLKEPEESATGATSGSPPLPPQ